MQYTVKVKPRYKKSVEEIEGFYNKELQHYVQYTTGWRYGEYYITCSEEEYKEIVELSKEDEYAQLEVTAYDDWELDHTFDQCWGGWESWKQNSAETQADREFAEELEEMEDAWLWLEIHEYYHSWIEVYIYGFEVELIETTESRDS